MDGSALPGSRRERRSLTLSIVLVTALAGGVFLAGKTEGSGIISQAREFGLALLTPVRWLGSLPGKYQQHRQDEEAEEDLREAYAQLRQEHRALQAELLALEGLRAENTRLRALLGAADRVDAALRAIRVARRTPPPVPHRLVLAAGSAENMTVGSPVLTPDGVLGQIEAVTRHESVVVLATEVDHAIPAVVARTGATTIVHGTGSIDAVKVSWLPQNTDIRVGDRLLTSGLGKRYPDGLPIAEIISVDAIQGERFLKIMARPLASSTAHPEVLVALGAASTQGIGQTDR